MIQGTLGRVYGGDPRYIHIPDGTRESVAAILAADLDKIMRQVAENRTSEERKRQPLCPGCVNVVGFDMMLILAEQTGQSPRELALTMVRAFSKLLENPEAGLVEEIEIVLDPC